MWPWIPRIRSIITSRTPSVSTSGWGELWDHDIIPVFTLGEEKVGMCVVTARLTSVVTWHNVNRTSIRRGWEYVSSTKRLTSVTTLSFCIVHLPLPTPRIILRTRFLHCTTGCKCYISNFMEIGSQRKNLVAFFFFVYLKFITLCSTIVIKMIHIKYYRKHCYKNKVSNENAFQGHYMFAWKSSNLKKFSTRFRCYIPNQGNGL